MPAGRAAIAARPAPEDETRAPPGVLEDKAHSPSGAWGKTLAASGT